jgi:hypothetical protein
MAAFSLTSFYSLKCRTRAGLNHRNTCQLLRDVFVLKIKNMAKNLKCQVISHGLKVVRVNKKMSGPSG